MSKEEETNFCILTLNVNGEEKYGECKSVLRYFGYGDVDWTENLSWAGATSIRTFEIISAILLFIAVELF